MQEGYHDRKNASPSNVSLSLSNHHPPPALHTFSRGYWNGALKLAGSERGATGEIFARFANHGYERSSKRELSTVVRDKEQKKEKKCIEWDI